MKRIKSKLWIIALVAIVLGVSFYVVPDIVKYKSFKAVGLIDDQPCSTSNRKLTINLISNSKSIEPIKFKIPKSYMAGLHNRRNGDREFVRLDAELDDMSPRCLRYQASSIETKPSSQIDKNSFSVKLTIGSQINLSDYESKIYTEFVTKDKYGYDLYSKKLSQEYIDKYGITQYYLKIPNSYQGLTKRLICGASNLTTGSTKNRHLTYKDEFGRGGCTGYFNYNNQLNIQYHFFHEHLGDIEMLENKAIQLVEKFKK